MKRVAACVSCVLLSVLTAEAQTQRNWIHQLNEECQAGVHYNINQSLRQVDIISGFANSSKRFKFAARTEEDQDGQWVDIGPGDINLIQIQPGVEDPGTVIIDISGSPGYPTGANYVKEIDLPTWQTASSDLWWIRIEEDLGEDGMSSFDEIGLVQLGGNLDGALFCIGDVTNAITIGGNLYANIQGQSLQNVTVNGSGPHSGNITVSGSGAHAHDIAINGTYAGDLTISGSLSGNVSIGTDLAGLVRVNSDCSGLIEVGGDVNVGGSIKIYGNNTGAIDVGDDVHGLIKIYGFSTGPIDIGDELISTGWIDVDHGCSSQATIDIGGHLAGNLDIGTTSGHHLHAVLTVGGDLTSSGSIYVAGDCTGSVHVVGGCLGPVEVGADLTSTGSIDLDQGCSSQAAIDIGGNLAGDVDIGTTSGHHLDGVLTVGGDLTSSGSIYVSGGMSGEIQINGSLEDGTGYEIEIIGQMDADTAAVAVDYDGYDPPDAWESGAVVRVYGVNYPGNTPTKHIWEITCQKGDMNNDGSVDGLDIDPFVMVLTDPNDPTDYDDAYPGLLGSVMYHTDCNCDDSINGIDIDPFVLRLTDPDQYYDDYPDCEECPARGGRDAAAGRSDPQYVAELLREYTAQERLPVLIHFIGDLVEYFGDTPRGRFWAAVLAELE